MTGVSVFVFARLSVISALRTGTFGKFLELKYCWQAVYRKKLRLVASFGCQIKASYRHMIIRNEIGEPSKPKATRRV
jgi:hypothetical protein